MTDETRLWTFIRTPERFAVSHDVTFTVDSPGLVARYNFDGGGVAAVLDRTGNGLQGRVNGGGLRELIVPLRPAETRQPVSQTTCAVNSITLEALWSGTSPALQQRHGGAPIAAERLREPDHRANHVGVRAPSLHRVPTGRLASRG